MFIAKGLASSLNISSYMFVMIAMRKENMTDNRYITERIEDKNGKLLMVSVTMKVYKEWVDENGEAQVFHKTDTEKFEV